MSPVSGVAKIVKFALRNWMKRERTRESERGTRDSREIHNTIFGTLQ